MIENTIFDVETPISGFFMPHAEFERLLYKLNPCEQKVYSYIKGWVQSPCYASNSKLSEVTGCSSIHIRSRCLPNLINRGFILRIMINARYRILMSIERARRLLSSRSEVEKFLKGLPNECLLALRKEANSKAALVGGDVSLRIQGGCILEDTTMEYYILLIKQALTKSQEALRASQTSDESCGVIKNKTGPSKDNAMPLIQDDDAIGLSASIKSLIEYLGKFKLLHEKASRQQGKWTKAVELVIRRNENLTEEKFERMVRWAIHTNYLKMPGSPSAIQNQRYNWREWLLRFEQSESEIEYEGEYIEMEDYIQKLGISDSQAKEILAFFRQETLVICHPCSSDIRRIRKKMMKLNHKAEKIRRKNGAVIRQFPNKSAIHTKILQTLRDRYLNWRLASPDNTDGPFMASKWKALSEMMIEDWIHDSQRAIEERKTELKFRGKRQKKLKLKPNY